MAARDLQSLERKLDLLIDMYTRVNRENKQLRAERAALQAERTRILEDNEVARKKVEHVMDRLAQLEERAHD